MSKFRKIRKVDFTKIRKLRKNKQLNCFEFNKYIIV